MENTKIVLLNDSGDVSSVEFDSENMEFIHVYKTKRDTEVTTVQVKKDFSGTLGSIQSELESLLTVGYELYAIHGHISFLEDETPTERVEVAVKAAKNTQHGENYNRSMSFYLAVLLLSSVSPPDWRIPELKITFNPGQACPVW